MVREDNAFFILEHDYIGPKDFCDCALKVLAFSAQNVPKTADNFSSWKRQSIFFQWIDGFLYCRRQIWVGGNHRSSPATDPGSPRHRRPRLITGNISHLGLRTKTAPTNVNHTRSTQVAWNAGLKKWGEKTPVRWFTVAVAVEASAVHVPSHMRCCTLYCRLRGSPGGRCDEKGALSSWSIPPPLGHCAPVGTEESVAVGCTPRLRSRTGAVRLPGEVRPVLCFVRWAFYPTLAFVNCWKNTREENKINDLNIPGTNCCISINQSINRSTEQSINQSINQSTEQSINQSINQGTSNQSIRNTFNQSINQAIDQSRGDRKSSWLRHKKHLPQMVQRGNSTFTHATAPGEIEILQRFVEDKQLGQAPVVNVRAVFQREIFQRP